MFRKLAYLFLSLIVLLPAARSQTDSLSVSDSLSVVPVGALITSDRVNTRFPWTVRSFNKDDISRFPFRGIESYLPLLPGVVQVNNEFHFRGSRSNEAGYFIEGIDVTNPMFGSNGVSLIPEAMEVLEVHTGPYGATMGSYNGGIVMSRMKTGGDRLSVHVDVQSDKLSSPGRPFLNTVVQGYENVVGTIGGPLPLFGIRFFLAAQRTAFANRQPMFLEPFRYDNLIDDGLYSFERRGNALPGPVAFNRDWLPGNRSERSTFQGNGSMELFGVSFKAIGSYDEHEYPVGSQWPNALTNYFNQSRNMLSRVKTRFGAIQATYSLGDVVTATMSYSFYDRFSKTFDQIFKDNWMAYPDSAANARYFDTSEWLDRYYEPPLYSTIYAFRFKAPGSPNNAYSKERQSQSRWAIDLVYHTSPSLTIKTGGDVDSWTMRSFSIGNINNLLRYLDMYWPYDGVFEASFSNDYERRIQYISRGNITTYGYTFLGKESDGYKLNGGPDVLLDPPYELFFASAFGEAEFQTQDFSMSVGLRYQYFDPQFKTVQPGPGPLGVYDVNYNMALGIMDESQIGKSEAQSFLLPRVNLRFSPSAQTSFYAGYGMFAQMPALNPLYVSSYNFSWSIATDDRSPYGGNLAFEVQPERSKQYEFGIEHALVPNIILRANVYYKILSNQVQLARYYDPAGTPLFTQYRNDGSGLAKGIEIAFEVDRYKGFSAQALYTYSVAQGITSHPRSNAVLVSDVIFPPNPISLRPYDYQQEHRLSLILDAQTDPSQGILLGGLSITSVITFSSGHPYTREGEMQNLGSASPWYVGVYPILDPRFSRPLEAHNSSTTPVLFNMDLRLAKTFKLDVVSMTLYADVLNVFNTKNIINVYPATGTANDDSWLSGPFGDIYRNIPNYESFYQDINLKNRWAYMRTGNDLYGPPRQIRIGTTVEF